MNEYPSKGRFTRGVLTTDVSRLPEIGKIVSARVAHERDQITIITANGIVLRTSVTGISSMGRSTRGVKVVNLGSGDSVAAVAVLNYEDLERGVDVSEDFPNGVSGAVEEGSFEDGRLNDATLDDGLLGDSIEDLMVADEQLLADGDEPE